MSSPRLDTTHHRRSRPMGRRSSTGPSAPTGSRHHPRHRDRVFSSPPRWHAEEGHRRWAGAALQPRRHAHLPARPTRRQCRAAQRDPRWGRRDCSRAVGERPATRAVARRQVGCIRGALPHVRHAVASHRPASHRGAREHGLSGGAGVARRGFLAALVGRQPACPLDAWPRALHAGARQDVRLRQGGQDAPSPPETDGVDIVFTQASDVPVARSALVGARLVTMAGTGRADVVERGVVVVRGNRIAAIGPMVASPFPPARRASTRPARRSCPASSMRMRTSAALAMG